MKVKLIVLLISFAIVSCYRYNAENLKGYIEYGLESDNYIRWSTEQQLKWEDFHGATNGDGIYYDYFGIYFFYELSEELKFNATLYFDKEKSWAKPREEWRGYDEQFQRLLNVKFDYYESVFREMRKELIENRSIRLDEELIRHLPRDYFERAEGEWLQIRAGLDFDRIDQQIDSLQRVVALRLKEFENFDTRVNSNF